MRHQLSFPQMQSLSGDFLGLDMGNEPYDECRENVTEDTLISSSDPFITEVVSAENENPVGSSADMDMMPTSRFKSVTDSDLDVLQSSTTAKSADNQTRWAVKVMKGDKLCLLSFYFKFYCLIN